MKRFEGKKILILAGANVHVKLAEAAKNLGAYTIVTDFLPVEESPAKKVADEYWMLNVTDVEGIIQRCKEEHVDGVVTGWIDVSQLPYYKICKALNLPCYGTYDLFVKLTNKHAFKQTCAQYGVGTIMEYSKDEALKGNVDYPVFVKPVDSRGSRGLSICNNQDDLISALEVAEKESTCGDVIIEKYLGDKNSFQVTYFFVNGEPFVLRTADGYKGLVEEKLDKVALCSVSPSIYTKEYMETTHDAVVKMLKEEGLNNGPVMLQAFYDNGVFRFYDPGLRFPGVEFDITYQKLFGVSVMEMLVEFALTGNMTKHPSLTNDNITLKGRTAAVLFPTISAGKIASIKGLDVIKNLPTVTCISQRYNVGEEVKWTYNVSQRLAEVNLLCESKEALAEHIKEIYSFIEIYDDKGQNMLYKPFDVKRLV